MALPHSFRSLRTLGLARWSLVLAALLPALAFLYAGYERRWAGDDGFINTRVVQQLVDGNGFVYNAGERCEAVTSAAWIFVLWAAAELGFNIDSAGWVLALALSFAGLLMASLAAARITRPDDEVATPTLVLPFGALAYAAVPVAWDYGTSLLENGLGLGFLGTLYWLMSRAVTARAPLSTRQLAASAAFIGLAPLVRPDFALYAAPMVPILLACCARWKPRLWVALAAALPGGAFQIFRMGYFAALVPNTAIAKEAFQARWEQGFFYLDNTVGSYKLAYPLALALLGLFLTVFSLLRDRKVLHACVPSALALSGLLHLLYVVRLGGDFMHGRMLLPGLFAVFAASATLRVGTRSLPQWASGAAGALAMLAFALYCASTLRAPYWEHEILDEHRWYSDTAHEPHPTHVEHYKDHGFYKGPAAVKARIAEDCPAGLRSMADDSGDYCKRVGWPDSADGLLSDHGESALVALDGAQAAPHVVAVFAFRPLGISGRVVGLRVNLTDSFGLADPLAARTELLQRGRPGHEKIFTTVWWAAKYAAPGATNDPRVALAKRALRCGELRLLQRATHEPLTASRFFKNLGLAFRLHRVRVPTDPQAAVDKFCKG